MGLKLMEYRSAVIGGVMGIKRLPGGGTRIRSVCPQDAGGAAPQESPVAERHSRPVFTEPFARRGPRRSSVSARTAEAIIRNKLTAFNTGVAPSRIRPYIMTVKRRIRADQHQGGVEVRERHQEGDRGGTQQRGPQIRQ